MRTKGVQLEKFPIGREASVWFPVRGITETFPLLRGERLGTDPSLVELHTLVDGTVRFNQGLPDEYFTVTWKGKRLETPKLNQTAKTFPKPSPRNDPEGIRQRLDAHLIRADVQAAQLEAPSPERKGWDWVFVSQIALTVVGAVVVTGALGWKLMSSRTR
jgi:hypothetical protein